MEQQSSSGATFGTKIGLGLTGLIRHFDLTNIPECNRGQVVQQLRREYRRLFEENIPKTVNWLGSWPDDLELVAGEAFTNAFYHNQPDKSGQEFVIINGSISSDDAKLIIINSTDCRIPFALPEVPYKLEENHRGMGIIIALIKTFGGKAQWQIIPEEQVKLTCCLPISNAPSLEVSHEG